MPEGTEVTRYDGGLTIQLFGWELSIRHIDYDGSYEELKKVIDDA